LTRTIIFGTSDATRILGLRQDRSLAPRLEGDIRPIAKDYLLEDYASDTRNQSVVKSVHIET
jgi:predicted TIM-barrel fold metal-dependent hydrolase